MEVEEVFARFRAIKHGIRIPRKSNSTWYGEHRSAFHGSGYDIAGIDRWRPGQPLKDVAWRLSLRSYPDKLFKIERAELKQLPALLVVDLSHSTLFEISRDSNKAMLLLDVIGVIGLTRARLHDPVGLLAFSDRIEAFVKPRLGSGQVFQIAHEIFERLELARTYSVKRQADFSVALRFLAARLRSRHSLVVISDLADVVGDPDTLDMRLLSRLASKHDVTLLVLDDPDEFRFRGRVGFVRTSNMETGEQTVISARKARLIRRSVEESIDTYRARLKRECGIDSVVLTPEDHFEALFKFLVTRGVH
jgi:uncharacterized protein (DUF58 family)